MRTPLRTALVVLLIVAAVPGATGFAAADAVGGGTASVAAADAVADVGVGGGEPAQAAACEFPVSKTDATETDVTVEAEPQRIVTLAPSAAQTVWEIGGEEKVVGVSQHAHYLEGAESRENISASGQSWVNVEAVVGLEPDLVLAPDVIPNETVQRLRDSGLTVYKYREAETLEDIQNQTLLTGELIGECAAAEERVDRMAARLETVRRAVEGADRPRVLYALGGGWTAGQGTFIDHIITTGGGENVAASANISDYATISPEVVAQQDPEWIVATDRSGVPDTAAYNGTTAVENDQVVIVDVNYINQPAPRTVDVVVQLAQAFHPEAYEAANATVTANATATANLDADAATSTDAESTDAASESGTPTAAETTASGTVDAENQGTGASVPGFGAVTALAALLATALLARRR